MKTSIRTRLAIIISLVFFSVFLFLIIAGSVSLYLGLTEEIDNTLHMEKTRMIDLFKSEFFDLTTASNAEREHLTDELLDELNEIYEYKHYFVVFSLESAATRRIYSGGGLRNAQLLLPKGFLLKSEGYYHQRLDGQNYRVHISQHHWGTLVIGTEYQIFLRIAEEFKDMLLIGVPLTLILVLIGGYLLARIAMKPAADAAKVADEITLTRLQNRLPEYKGRDEFGVLVITLNRMIKRIEEGVQRIQQFTQDASHELRTPIAILRGELEWMYQKEEIPDDLRPSFQKTLDQVIGMGKIVEDLMLLAQSDSGEYALQKQTFPLDKIIIETYEDVRILAEVRSIHVLLSHCDRVVFAGEESLIRRLLLNISDNALKYTQKGKIEFNLHKRKKTIEITIKDTGIGISEEDLPHIFDRFYRVDKTKKNVDNGSGLGLAICKWIVDAHKGEINIVSQPSLGTTVRITFPLSKPPIMT